MTATSIRSSDPGPLASSQRPKDYTPPPLVGITGTIASGKSEVARYLREQGWTVFDADLFGHQVLEKDSHGYHLIVTRFGKDILDENGEISRAKLGKIVFEDPEKLEKLNQISHPRIAKMIQKAVQAEYQTAKGGVLFLEAALLIEAGWHPLCDSVWLVEASEEVLMQRLQTQRKLTLAEAQARIDHQWPLEEKRPHANFILENNGTVEELHRKVDELLKTSLPSK